MKELIQAAREKAGKLIADTRALGVKIREAQAKKEPIAEMDAQFLTMSEDTELAITELNRLEREAELETQHKRFTEPAESFTGRRPAERNDGTPNLNRQQRKEAMRLKAQKEMFARAGVQTMADFHRFKEAHEEAFFAYVREGNGGAMASLEAAGFKPMEAFALLSTSGDLGGFLVSDDIRAEVIKDMAGMAVMRRLCRVERTGKSTLVFPSIQSATSDADMYSTGYTGAWQPEGYVTGGTAPTVQNQPKFGQNRVPVHVWAPNAVEITQELLSDSDANLDSIMAEVIAETLGLDEDAGFLNGSGVGQPMGIMSTVSGLSITEVNTGHATQITYDGIVDLFTGLAAQYRQNARWLLNSLTLGAILKLKDGTGEPLFPVNALPNMLFGKPMEFSEFMPDIAASANPILFGDFKYYCIADRQELRVQRLTERYAPNVGILPTARVGGQVLRTAAFRKQKVSA